jgi:hypothetical protein
MVKFLAIERINSVVAISSQPQHLNEVGDWIRTISSNLQFALHALETSGRHRLW